MLLIPDSGFIRSVNTVRMDIGVVSDWFEGSILFEQDELSKTDLLDSLLENELCGTPTIAQQIVEGVWNELNRRVRWMQNTSGIHIDGRWVIKKKNWEDVPAHTFCILLSLAPNYSWWFNAFGRDYTEQGELFELITKASLQTQFDDNWIIIQTGWTRSNASRLPQVVSDIANHLYESPRELPSWINSQSKEIGLDLLCFRRFQDNRPGIPVYMLQCASGNDWTSKLHTPKLGRWRKIIDFYSHPMKGVAIPFCLNDDKFMASTLDIEGLLIERCRLLCAESVDQEWLSDDLKQRLIDWSTPRIEELLKRSR